MVSLHTGFFWILFTAAIFHLIPIKHWQARITLVSTVSFGIIYAFYPLAAITALFFALYTWALYKLSLKRPMLQKYGPLSLFVLLAIFSVMNLAPLRDFHTQTLLGFGMSFYTFRLYGAIRSAQRLSTPTSCMEFIVLTLFFPIFAAGPIAYQDAFRSAQGKPLALMDWVYGTLRMCAGAFFLYYGTEFVENLMEPYQMPKSDTFDWASLSAWESYQVTILKFLHLYFNFTGYSEIAIGLGLFFGFKIPENFKFPLFSNNIQNFWKRWHLSLSNFIITFLYLPLAVQFRRPKLALFMSFALVGLWHQVSLQYLLWGVGHGLALIVFQKYEKLKPKPKRKLPAPFNWALYLLGVIVTISYVAILSNVANQNTISDSFYYVRSLTGMKI